MTRVVPVVLVLSWVLLAQAQPNSGRISGHVVSADTGRGIPNAPVALEAGLDASWTVTTGADGAFAFTRVKPGRYSLLASAAGYKTARFGEDANLYLMETLVSVSALAPTAELTLALHRGATIAGVVMNDLKEPVIGDEVRAFADRSANGGPRLLFMSMAKTDDRGAYRLIALDAGEYTVGVVDGLSMAFAMSPRTPAERRQIAVRTDGEVTAVNIQTRNAPTGSISGQLAGPGAGLPGLDVRVFPDPDPAGIWPITSVRSQAGAHFSIADLPTGRYTLIVRPGLPNQPGALGRANVIVAAGSESTPVITLHEGASVSGRVTGVRTSGRITIDPIGADHPEARTASAPIGSTGTFTIGNVGPGRYRWVPDQQLTSSRSYLLSVFIKDADVTDQPFDVGPDVTIGDVRITVTDGGRIVGNVLGRDGKPATTGGVVIASLDPPDWTRVSRRIRLERPDTAGHYESGPLPPGRYSVSLVATLAPGQLWDPAFLKTRTSVPVTVVEGQSATVELRLK